jgi:hypothetical protein
MLASQRWLLGCASSTRRAHSSVRLHRLACFRYAVTTIILASPDLAALSGALLGHCVSETSRSHHFLAR